MEGKIEKIGDMRQVGGVFVVVFASLKCSRKRSPRPKRPTRVMHHLFGEVFWQLALMLKAGTFPALWAVGIITSLHNKMKQGWTIKLYGYQYEPLSWQSFLFDSY